MVAFVFGVEVATNLLVNAALPLLDHPDRWRRLGADPQQAEDAIAEAMVLDPPVRLHGLLWLSPGGRRARRRPDRRGQ